MIRLRSNWSLLVASAAIALGLPELSASQDLAEGRYFGLREVNPPASPEDGSVVAIVGARLIDGLGGPPIPDSAVVVRGEAIDRVGPRSEVAIPDGAIVVDASGMSLLPGLIDAHFHHDYSDPEDRIVSLALARGVTSLRDPGHPIRDYDSVRNSPGPMPRCFLTGKHFDQPPHAHPHDAEAILNASEVEAAVDRHLADGASAIKVYYRLPPDLIAATCSAAHARGVPVTAHLELVDADRAIAAGLDGVEHITSFGTALAPPADADRFREAVRGDNTAREDGRYRLWAAIDLEDNPRVQPLIDLILERGVVLSPTLAVFERRAGDSNAEEFHVRGFETMLRFVRRCHEAGVPIVVGSHTWVPHAERGRAFRREMQLLVECGLSPGEAIVAATSRNARFLGCADRLGAIAPGRLADLILVDGNPLDDVAAIDRVGRVMLNGRWVSPPNDQGEARDRP
ncbi:amidohydrolase family protein [Tautonia sociabilis]|uniref:Amidohydrolase n=1 Tax=Tautonia sociabilis TaxID=2080755 RepID=A0A432MDT7_9BACT|nr:amidohydrolase family protein [Tautonia sociabilis]RUL83097.1 amidohydrolase [Tautonia sociabilis]